MTTTAKIFGTPDQEQEVSITFEYITIPKFLSEERLTYFVNFCKVHDRLDFRPSDIDQDIAVAVAQALGLVNERDIRIECEVKYSIKPVTKDIDYSQILFI
jgi:hypothetical protein